MVTPSPPRVPRQRRSRKTLARLVDAGLALLGEGGPDQVTVQDVVARSGTSVGSFYQRFGGKDEFLTHLTREAEARALESLEAAIEDRIPPSTPLAARLEALVEIVAGEAEARPSSGWSPDREGRMGVLVGRVVADAPDPVAHPEPQVAARVTLAVVAGAVLAAPEGLARERLIGELVSIVRAYWMGREPDQPQSVDFFDVWG